MTLQDLIDSFNILYEINSLAIGGLTDGEILAILEMEQYKIINQKIQGNNVYNTKFPDTPKRIDDLFRLLKSENIDITNIPGMNEYISILPSDYLHIHEVRVPNVASPLIYTQAESISINSVRRVSNGFRNNNPVLSSPKYTITNSGGNNVLKLYYFDSNDEQIDVQLNIIYIKRPINLKAPYASRETVLTDFNDDVYYEIIRSAVNSAIAIATPEKYPISQQELNKTE
ncbi:MAG: hypothetical protein M0R51_06490 [Clostridia bacterium]|jgi:hypothetical protein|nr:hypothetical protein [Clostridia bacterium]